MKRLRAPEQSESKATTPAAGALADSAPPQAAADPSTPSSAIIPEGPPVAITGVPAGAETGQPAAEAEASTAEPQQPSPAPQEVETTSRCNGEASAGLHGVGGAGDEQG